MTTHRPAADARVEHLQYHYPDGSPALLDVSVSVAAGERVAVLGPNGAGKSTLLLHLAGLLPERRRYLHVHAPGAPSHAHAAHGTITIDGTRLEPASIARIRQLVGFVFQDPDDQLIGLTVDEDVAYGPRARRWSEEDVSGAVREALDAVGLAGYGHRSPHHLSTGERRRVCLAGVLACRPGLLLLDEPSSGLDPRGRRSLAGLLSSLPATQLVATHDLQLVERVCARALIMDEGRIVADGPVAHILGDEPLLREHGLA